MQHKTHEDTHETTWYVCSLSHVPRQTKKQTNSCLAAKISPIDKQNPQNTLLDLIW